MSEQAKETLVPVDAAERILATPAADLRVLARRRIIPKIEKGDTIALLRTIPRLISHIRSGIVTAAEAGARMGTSQQWVLELIKQGYVNRAPGGGVVLAEAMAGYIKWLKDDQRRATKSGAESRVRDARAREIELRTARDEQELIPTEEAVAYAQTVVGALVSRLNGLPAQFTRDLDERRRLEAAIDGIRQEVATVMSEHGPGYRGLPDVVDADAED
jgi:hypothetical protein